MSERKAGLMVKGSRLFGSNLKNGSFQRIFNIAIPSARKWTSTIILKITLTLQNTVVKLLYYYKPQSFFPQCVNCMIIANKQH